MFLSTFFIIVHEWRPIIIEPARLPGSQLVAQRIKYGLLVPRFEHDGLDLLGVEYPAPLALLQRGQVLHVEVPADARPHILRVLQRADQIGSQLFQHRVSLLAIVGDDGDAVF